MGYDLYQYFLWEIGHISKERSISVWVMTVGFKVITLVIKLKREIHIGMGYDQILTISLNS
ncbi:hypothetical protein SAMN06295933_1762 [Desulfovibrio gilichinskyi]|uniref:Uncharacterized protein n=1 Tax=Desulfovibrio gilichinskyi TaxID=1519643 RepID=A0A1X7DDB3_9BACT|nr:hypothetical protein SAMN06295933_1762 [Desulfovibrio gilichinskyi]